MNNKERERIEKKIKERKEIREKIYQELEFLNKEELESLLNIIKHLTKGIKSYKGII